ncbi:MAG TPA: hypothetical protein VNU70_11435 [Puia sp.]|nr:hypothetical protein [Puia sp.]
MSGTHPSDEVLQQFILERAACTAEEIIHIGSCPDCQAATAAYEALTIELASRPVPAFDFDLAAAVIAQLAGAAVPTQEIPRVRQRKAGSMLTIVLIAAFIGIPFWLFRRSAYFVFTDMSAVFYWLVLAASGIVVGLFLFRLYRKYQQVIRLIN